MAFIELRGGVPQGLSLVSEARDGVSGPGVSLQHSDGLALINTAIDGRAACYVAYYRSGNLLILIPDNGDSSQATSMIQTGTNSVSNGQCTVSAQGSSATVSGNQLTLNLNITFKPAFSGPKGVWMAVATLSGQHSGWQVLGAWRVP